MKNDWIRKIILSVSAVYLIALALAAIALYRASPGPVTQDILGVGIGSYDGEGGIVYLSGRRLSCARMDASELFTSRCTVQIAGELLEIYARRNAPPNPHQLGGACQAFYAGKQWPCRFGSRHVHIPWFAYIGEPLGLSQGQLDALRRQYFFENLSEQPFIAGIFAIPVVTLLVVIIASLVWLWPKSASKVGLAALSIVLGVVSLPATFLAAVFLTNGFWD